MVNGKKMFIAGAVTATICLGVATGYRKVTRNIPHCYRQNLFDILDYITGTNLFNRSSSLF